MVFNAKSPILCSARTVLSFSTIRLILPSQRNGGERVHVDPFVRIRGCRKSRTARNERKRMDNPFMARAIQLSLDNVLSGQGGPFGAVIVKDDRIIAEGVNRVTVTNDPTAHAEVVAIREACARLKSFALKGCEIYTSCEPCPMCLGAIYWAHLSRIHFGNLAADAAKVGFDDSFIYHEFAQPFPQRKIPILQMMREEALAAFRAWQEKPNKIPY
jgi:guanine deaminase